MKLRNQQNNTEKVLNLIINQHDRQITTLTLYLFKLNQAMKFFFLEQDINKSTTKHFWQNFFDLLLFRKHS